MAEQTKEQALGLYSAEAAKVYGTTFWLTPEGKEIEITAFSEPSKYLWPDTAIIGPATKYVRKGQMGSRMEEMRELDNVRSQATAGYGRRYRSF